MTSPTTSSGKNPTIPNKVTFVKNRDELIKFANSVKGKKEQKTSGLESIKNLRKK